MLSVNVGTLLQQVAGTNKIISINDEVASDEEIFWVKGEVRLTKTNRCVVAEGDLVATGVLRCSRCLQDFSATFPVKFTEEYFTKGHLMAIAHEANDNDDLEDWFLIDGRNILDFTEALRQYCIMAEPISPKCQPNCNINLIN